MPRHITTFSRPTIERNGLAQDILQQPHTLIAGCTGSGKSTFLDTLLYNLVSYAPSEKSYAIIDLKRVSVIRWKPLPHCLAYATEPDTALSLLDRVVNTMESRFKMMEQHKLTEFRGGHIYLVIDEAADLLDTVKNSYAQLKRIARLGRAAHIHLILCSQSPNRKVLPADLTLNITAKLGLRCDSPIESRQIIGDKGCEALPRYGQGRYKSPDYRSPVLVNVPMTSDSEISRVITHWTTQSSGKRRHIA